MIAKLRKEESRSQRRVQAEQLGLFIQSLDPDTIDDVTIDELAELLIEEDDAIRFWAAGSLGFLGRRGKRALPALRRALANPVLKPLPDGLVRPVTSEDAIRLAIERIEGRQPIPHRD